MRTRGPRSRTPDLFSTMSARETVTVSPVPPVRHVLPSDLPNAVKQLGDNELERLTAAVLAEQKRRCRKQEGPLNKQPVDVASAALTPSKINAVRAAFKAGIKPSRIARQFGISQADVQRALARGRE
jgi:predicted DNA-binding protein (UPF0251 family)